MIVIDDSDDSDADNGDVYLVTDPGQDEDNQDQENLQDPQDAGQGAEEVAASPNTPGQESDNDPVIVMVRESSA